MNCQSNLRTASDSFGSLYSNIFETSKISWEFRFLWSTTESFEPVLGRAWSVHYIPNIIEHLRLIYLKKEKVKNIFGISVSLMGLRKASNQSSASSVHHDIPNMHIVCTSYTGISGTPKTKITYSFQVIWQVISLLCGSVRVFFLIFLLFFQVFPWIAWMTIDVHL